MPDFARAQITDTTDDLSSYNTFLRRLSTGQVVTLPLEAGESSRAVMRALNRAASQSSMRLARVPSDDGVVRFRVLSAEKRTVTRGDGVRQSRAEDARVIKLAIRGAADGGVSGGSESVTERTQTDQEATAPSPSTNGVQGQQPEAAPRRRRVRSSGSPATP